MTADGDSDGLPEGVRRVTPEELRAERDRIEHDRRESRVWCVYWRGMGNGLDATCDLGIRIYNYATIGTHPWAFACNRGQLATGLTLGPCPFTVWQDEAIALPPEAQAEHLRRRLREGR